LAAVVTEALRGKTAALLGHHLSLALLHQPVVVMERPELSVGMAAQGEALALIKVVGRGILHRLRRLKAITVEVQLDFHAVAAVAARAQ
jgi:hypothetical protein